MALSISNIDEVQPMTTPCNEVRPVFKPNNTFIGTYPPISKAGTQGSFFVNTHLIQPERKFEVAGPVPVRSRDFI